jgi:hypothetical protein
LNDQSRQADTNALPSSGAGLKARLLARADRHDAMRATCESPLHGKPIGCPHCVRDKKDAALLREAAASLSPAARAEESPQIDCPLCGETVQQVASATLSLALWQHCNWTCPKLHGPAGGARGEAMPAERNAGSPQSTGTFRPSKSSAVREEARSFPHYFNKGRCGGGSDTWNGRYCRDAAGPERWCINCAGFVLQNERDALLAERDSLTSQLEEVKAERDRLEQQMRGHSLAIRKALLGDEPDTGRPPTVELASRIKAEHARLSAQVRETEEGRLSALRHCARLEKQLTALEGALKAKAEQWRRRAKAQREMVLRPDCLNPIGMAGMADANDSRADDIDALLALPSVREEDRQS